MSNSEYLGTNNFIKYDGVKWAVVKEVVPPAYVCMLSIFEEAIDSTDGTFLPIWVISPGGDFGAFLAIRDYIQEVKKRGIPVVTQNSTTWGCKSAGLSIYATGDLRYTTLNSEFMLHSVSCVIDDAYEERMKKADATKRRITNIQQGEDKYKDDDWVLADVTKKTDVLFSLFAEDLGIPTEKVYEFLDKHSEGRNEVTFGVDIAKEIGLYTDIGLGSTKDILNKLKIINSD